MCKDCAICGIAGGCLASMRDDYYIPASKEQVIERLNNNEFPNYRGQMIEYLKKGFKIDYKGKGNITVYDGLSDVNTQKLINELSKRGIKVTT